MRCTQECGYRHAGKLTHEALKRERDSSDLSVVGGEFWLADVKGKLHGEGTEGPRRAHLHWSGWKRNMSGRNQDRSCVCSGLSTRLIDSCWCRRVKITPGLLVHAQVWEGGYRLWYLWLAFDWTSGSKYHLLCSGLEGCCPSTWEAGAREAWVLG